MKKSKIKQDNIKQAIEASIYSLKLPIKIAPKLYILYCSVSLVRYIIPMLSIIVFKLLIDRLAEVYTDGINLYKLAPLVAVYLVISILNSQMDVLIEWMSSLLKDKIKFFVDLEIINKSASIDIECFEDSEKQDYIDAVDNSQWAITEGILCPVKIIGSIISFISVNIVFLLYNPILAIIFILTNIPYALVSVLTTNKLDQWLLDSIPITRRKEYYLQLLTDRKYAKEMRVYNLRDYYKEKYYDCWNRLLKQRKDILKKGFRMVNYLSMFLYIGDIFIIIYATNQGMNGKISIGELGLYVAAIATVTETFSEIIVMCGTYFGINVSRIKKYMQFMKWESKLIQGNCECPDEMVIDFENVSFRYRENEEDSLKNVTFHIGIGQKVAIAGVNGAGKTTIVKLLLRMYQPSTGRILINGRNINEYRIESIRKHFAACFQDVIHYGLTVRECVAMSEYSKKSDSDKIKEKIDLVGLLKDIEKWPNNIDTPLTRMFEEDGKELSGGQWQRLGIARTLFRNASFLIFDEPTSAIDALAEQEIFRLFYSALNHKSAIIISHRLSGITLADHIIFMKDGRIVEQGKHQELIERNGEYATLYNLQAEKYKSGSQEI